KEQLKISCRAKTLALFVTIMASPPKVLLAVDWRTINSYLQLFFASYHEALLSSQSPFELKHAS
ncbi:hypothetical protein, partial [Mycobacterium tuberculosis]|uniref:hypothetical protein n=1 Tax=Mycobacterium tuberculosis TaxID=1773 RepID=UPI00255114CF